MGPKGGEQGGQKEGLRATGTSSCHVQVLGVGTDTGTTVPSALLFFDRQRYLFNAGEGFQRFCVEHKLKLSKMSAVLLTRTNTEASGGLPGMLLTMADTSCGGLLSSRSGMRLVGPPGLHTLVNAFRTFINVRDLGLAVDEFGASRPPAADAAPASSTSSSNGAVEGALPPVVSNELVTICPVVIEPIRAGESAAGSAEAEPQAKRPRLGAASGEDAPQEMPSVTAECPAACYMCELADIPGKFMPQKAASLGVPRGPLYGKLVKGEEVTASSGRVVKPSDVMGPATPGPIVLIVDCPSAAFLPRLLAAPLLLECATGSKRSRVACAVHLGPREVVQLPEYTQWLGTFRPEVSHLLVAESISSGVPIQLKAATLQAKLNVLDPGLFPLHSTTVDRPSTAGELPAGCVVGSNMLRYHLRPVAKQGIDAEDCGSALDEGAVQQELKEGRPEVVAAAAAAVSKSAAAADKVPESVARATREQLEVTFLGTGAAIPSKYRNVTGVHVNRFSKGGLLMDCGEGSYGQLRRRFGQEQADALIRDLSCIWISHIHADHHVGLPAILAARTRMLGQDSPPLLVLGPRPLRRALQAYALLEPMRFQWVDVASTAAGAAVPEAVRAAVEGIQAALGLDRFESVPVMHCAHSYGLVLESASEGWKMVFSGDTQPCEQLVEAAKGATLLIHEATFDDSMAAEAQAKKHSTTGGAVSIGARAGAYRTLLTHFSQRYPKIPVVDESFQGHYYQDSVGIAFDLMSVNLADLPRLPDVVPALKLLLEEQQDDDVEPLPPMLT